MTLVGVLLGSGCVQRPVRILSEPGQAASLDPRSEYLKAHMRDGRLYVLGKWSVDPAEHAVSGQGELRALDRSIVERGSFVVPIDEVALFETNRLKPSPAVSALAVITGISLAVTAYCIANPKSCFGSCPTFYVSDGKESVLQAEGFSDSVAPSLEERDVDALFRARPQGRELAVQMKNEALETHVVRQVSLLAVPRPAGGRAFAGPNGEFWAARRLREPTSCQATDGDCRDALARLDGVERFSRTDGKDLATRETIDLTFSASPDEPVGIVLASRQTLLSTFLFYQTLAYMGRSASGWLAALERGESGLRERLQSFRDALGGIEVLVPDGEGGWRRVGEVREAGPLASDVKVVPLPRGRGTRVRLRLARGQWRLDWVALAELEASVAARRISPVRRVAEGGGGEESAGAGPLVTFPGDVHRYEFRLPEDPERLELFLETRGYYLEWMRDEWLAEESPERLARLLASPEQALRELAPSFAAREAGMDEVFWRSRYARP